MLKCENGKKAKIWKRSKSKNVKTVRKKNCENGPNVETVKMQNCENVKM